MKLRGDPYVAESCKIPPHREGHTGAPHRAGATSGCHIGVPYRVVPHRCVCHIGYHITICIPINRTVTLTVHMITASIARAPPSACVSGLAGASPPTCRDEDEGSWDPRISAQAMVKARGDRVCPRGRLFFSSQTEKGDEVDCGGMGIFPHSGGGGVGTSQKI